MSRFALATLTLSTSLLLAGCGQTGPLYLPTDEAAAERYGNAAASQGERAEDDAHEDTD
ncbi:MAG: lipoprotein [Halomonas sp.]|nr:lipoprotein [Halomonas sp.]MCC5881867.1 lipoprotein [Halomonas sp.]